MSPIYPEASKTVGHTPLVELSRLTHGMPGRVAAKLEMRNPAGSVKDRLGVALIEDAEARGVLRPGMTIVEATGGNTGIGLAFAAAIRGYKLILVMPESMSAERVALLNQYGAKILLTPGIFMTDAVARARELAKTPGCIYLDQFSNPANVTLHRTHTGPEIWEDSAGIVDVFVSAVGTGGTLTGVGAFLKDQNPSIRLVAVEPSGAAVLSGRPLGCHQMPGIGVGFIPPILDRTLIDEIIAVDDQSAFACARALARREGILAGVSAGAALFAALAIAKRQAALGKLIVVLLPDTGERYISSNLFERPGDGLL
jgi:cysteine synthase A